MQIEELRKKVAPLLQSHGVTRAALFGSAARGEAHAESDIDIAVEIGSDMSLIGFVGLKQLLEERLGRLVDLVEYRALKPALKEKIIRESIPLL